MRSERLAAWAALLSICAFTLTVCAQKQVAPPPETLSPAEAAIQGRALVDEILQQRPSQSTTNTGIMIIRNARGTRIRVPIKFAVFATSSNWVSEYSTPGSDRAHYTKLTVLHSGGRPNRYIDPNINAPPRDVNEFLELKTSELFRPFVPGSDFWVADLGLEFFHWPEQRIIKKEMKRSRACQVLESINPHPTPGAYSRVISWIDNESHGIVMAEAYDSQGKLLKQFIPKHFEKVQGQWQVQEMEIDNVQTDSSTRVDFDMDTSK